MKKITLNLSVLVMFIFILQACMQPQNESQEAYIGKKEIVLKSDLMTPEVLWSFGRVSSATLSPDKQTILYRVMYYDIPLNKGNADLYTISVDGSNPKQITRTTKSESSPGWTPDGKKISFMYDGQLWEMNPDGSNRKQITAIEGGITGYKYAPDMSKIIYSKEVKFKPSVQDIYPDLPLATGRIENDLMYRHWDHWVDAIPHIFVADYNGNTILNSVDILEGEPYEAPNAPFGGMEQVNWSPDSKTIAYNSRKKTGVEYAISTNTDIYLYDVETKSTKNISEEMMGYDIAPVFSPDGKKIAWESMEHDGYESDKNRLWIYDLTSGKGKDYTKDFDQNVSGLVWSDDSKSIYFTSVWHAKRQIYDLNVTTGVFTQITSGTHDFISVIPGGDILIAEKESMSLPTEIFSVDRKTGEEKQLTFTNKELLDQLSMGKVEERWVKTVDDKDMLVWVIYPPHFDPNKKYPAILYCKGGPQGALSQDFHYRWNYQIMAAHGYIIVAPNRRGVDGFGHEWEAQISKDYHGLNQQDYLRAIDELAKEPYVDENRLGAVGASYGGYSVFYLAGHHNKRFKAFIAHDGIFNKESQYLETEEMWFENWDVGGPFWDKRNKAAQETYANSPHKFVKNWDTPILVIHGELDYRVLYTQGMSAFNAARLRGIPAQFLFYPDENHWVLQPQNAILWQRTFFGWLDKWLK